MSVTIRSLQPLGDSAAVVQFEQRIDADIHEQVLTLQGAIDRAAMPGVEFLVPAYCSLTVGFNPLVLTFDRLGERIDQLAKRVEPTGSEDGNVWHVPVCYSAEVGLDLDEVGCATGLSEREIIDLHVSRAYRVFMLGFLPGFAYLGKLPAALECSRKAIARTKVPAGSVAIAGRQTAIYPAESPGGWRIIGRTSWLPFDQSRNDPFRLHPGDTIQFVPVTHEEFVRGA